MSTKIVPLADEIRTAIALLHKRGLVRAANRLERLSENILTYRTKQPKVKAQKVKLVGASGRMSAYKIDEDLLDGTEPVIYELKR